MPQPVAPLDSHRLRGFAWATLAVYSVLIVYGSLYPFGEWRSPENDWWEFLFAAPPRFITRTDLTTNVLAYVPLGLLLSILLAPYMRVRSALVWAFAAGALLSFAMETVQQFVPNRVASNLDVLTNACGSLVGGLVFRVIQHHRWPGRLLFGWRERWFAPGKFTDLGLILLVIWVISQLSLELPSLLAGSLHKGFTPYWEALTDLSRVHPERAIIYALEIVSLGLFARILVKPGHRVLALVVGVLAGAIASKFVAAAVLVKFSVLSRLISLEVLAGFAAGVVALLALLRRGSERRPYGVAIASLLALAAAKLWWVPVSAALAPNVTSSAERMLNITGLAAVASTLWPYLAALFLSAHWLVSRARVR
jgi:VanZ family protein